MRVVQAIRDTLAQLLMGVVGVVFGVLSAIALAIAVIIPPILGLLAFVLSPLRTILDRLRRSNAAASR